MTTPTKEQVLEWVMRAQTPHNRPAYFHELVELCAIAYAAGKADGVRLGGGTKVYCCYGMYVDVGHSEDCQHYRRPAMREQK